ncbi:MAG: hypothetical protein A3F74_27545 [Betaproteobacteria bacterium RIFCSPLOWO2_12_FULL_62_58]|nr:MAG: hypothetical protein A3F74_27545 [Betaproteobacteria bacterium RIFCSPLOWO2_12_FULL_62_58]
MRRTNTEISFQAIVRVAALCIAAIPIAVQAQSVSYPSKPIRLVVPFAAGGSTEVLARVVGQELGAAVGQPIVIDIRPGAGGQIGSDIVARSAPDGYTILMIAVGHAVNPSLYRKLPYDTVKGFAPITLVANVVNALVVHPAVAATSTKELIALAKAQPGTLNYASGGIGSGAYLAAQLFNYIARIHLVHVPYKGVGQAVPDLLGGRVQIMFPTLPTVIHYLKAERLRALAVTTKVRSRAAPELPTIAESGLPGYEMSQWFGLLAPAHTPASIIGRLNAEVGKVMNIPDVRERLAAQGADAVATTPQEFAFYIKSEMGKWAKVIKASGELPH